VINFQPALTVSDDDRLREALAEQIRRAAREEESRRDGFQHDYEAVRAQVKTQIEEREKKRDAGEGEHVQPIFAG